jgi:hypothetical protein
MPILRGVLLALMLLAALPAARADDSLVEQGRRLFFGETFAGNGRTCGSCHPADNNYTIDAAYIARLPADDPLFTASFLDRPQLLRKLGLVVVHADGFDRPGLLRAVPSLLGIARSLAREDGTLVLPGTDRDLVHATGWSGDGAPGTGSLHAFALGAVKEHLTKTIARIEGQDFRRPTGHELDALEAFMRTLGRRATDELELGNFVGVTFRSRLVECGRELFNSEVSGPCAFCHRNATALNEAGFNGMFDIGIQRRRDTPARHLDPTVPADGGFGGCPVGAVSTAGGAGCGDGRFNTPSVIEAADTAPLFHDHSAATVEDAVRFYTTPTFAHSPQGEALPIIRLRGPEIVAIGALLRTLNAIENIRSSNDLLGQALDKPGSIARPLLHLAAADTTDAVAVLTGGPQHLYAAATTLLGRAQRFEQVAARVPATAVRDYLLRRAVELKERAKAMIFTPSPGAAISYPCETLP